jgi:hypothetical protein
MDSVDLSCIKKLVLAVPNAFELWAREAVERAARLAGMAAGAIRLEHESKAGVNVRARRRGCCL